MAPNEYDAIVIGGGHNGLVSAAYQGRAGLQAFRQVQRDRALRG